MPRYNPAEIEPKWQRYWEENRTFASPELPGGKKLYALDMFPYPSGQGLHVGHPEGYTATDIVSRYQRMRGVSVLHPMGFDAFGLPAEEFAIRTGTHPRVSTEKNVNEFRRQLKMLGFSYDWDRELSTTDEDYFRWTQWIFLQLFDTWFDADHEWADASGKRYRGRGRPMSELPIPPSIQQQGDSAIRRYEDSKRLAFQSEVPVNWCPALGTVLANEEVINGRSERGDHPVERRPLKQWMLRITAYGERLHDDLEYVDWPDHVKKLQRDWIGRSTGAEVDFFIGLPGQSHDGKPAAAAFETWQSSRVEFPEFPGDECLRIYTTRPDTLYGATYMVVAPEHRFVPRLTTSGQRDAVEAYCEQAARKSDLDRTELAKTKTGVFTGSYATNPVNGEPIPIWVADYVLATYGTGAIMAVPAHDVRDFEFAKQFDLPIRAVVDPGEGYSDKDNPKATREAILAGEVPFAGHGTAVHSSLHDGTPTADFKAQITAELAKRGVGRQAVNFKLRDWLFSRQRFWGEPFPLLHELGLNGEPTGIVRAVPESDLPVLLPHLEDFKPHGRPEPMLAKAPHDWQYVELNGKRYRRELNTMPQWAGSCWYYLRFIDPSNSERFVDPIRERAWMPVDLYVGGVEHAVLHLLYSRFWHKVLFDRGLVSTVEPFQRLVNQGMILGEMEITAFRSAAGQWVSAQETRELEDAGRIIAKTQEKVEAVRLPLDAVTKQGEHFVLIEDPKIRVEARAYKMSKSRNNVVSPNEVVRDFGADSLRLYEMFMGPLEATKPWSMAGVGGVRGFLDRAWRMITDEDADDVRLNPKIVDRPATGDDERIVHRTIQFVTDAIENMAFNTAIAKFMEFVNHFTKADERPREAMEMFTLLLAPFAPHIAEEFWELLGHRETLTYEPWPRYDEAKLREDTIEIPVQILGKMRGKVRVAADADNAAIEAAARDDERIASLLEGKTVKKVIVVPGRLINFVAS
jgi:leucyl-tRNA synthetase